MFGERPCSDAGSMVASAFLAASLVQTIDAELQGDVVFLVVDVRLELSDF